MFVVAKRFGRSEMRLKNFTKQAEAVIFIMEKLAEDIRFKVAATYCLYEGADLLKEFTQKEVVEGNSGSSSDAATGGSQKGSSQSFRPNPFSTTPKLGPQSWVVGDEDKDEDQKK